MSTPAPNPFLSSLGVRELDTTDDLLNPSGAMHGGVLATLVDTAMGAAVRSSTGEDEVPATSQLTVTYLRPGKPGRLEVTAAVFSSA